MSIVLSNTQGEFCNMIKTALTAHQAKVTGCQYAPDKIILSFVVDGDDLALEIVAATNQITATVTKKAVKTF